MHNLRQKVQPEVLGAGQSIYTMAPICKEVAQSKFWLLFELYKACVSQKEPVVFMAIELLKVMKDCLKVKFPITKEVKSEALKLLDTVPAKKLIDFVYMFQLGSEVSDDYFKTRIAAALKDQDFYTVATIVVYRGIYAEVDNFELCAKLGERNKDLVFQILSKNDDSVSVKLIRHFTNDKDYRFACDIVQECGYQLSAYPDLALMRSARHGIIDMAFTDPKTDKKHVPLHVMEDLVKSDQRLLQKLFFSMILRNMPHRASGLYQRQNFASWCSGNVRDAYEQLPKYDPSQDQPYQDKFGPFRSDGLAMCMPSNIETTWVEKPADVPKLKVLIGKPFIGADSEWKC